ncbi:hypothetical protein JAAARDRAFT_42827 [Jaapia argillacea MUCL 33604]|uniref:DUF3533 domain-containing protein n=1 Tax=Jaapia argillacea MUCL 33604 TaxID=933084 RepID=A0A067P442_9AGAM|nr:hypothetical protein JAAARDRAFT_42827 [Jaapia argillacea MUCL 33604]
MASPSPDFSNPKLEHSDQTTISSNPAQLDDDTDTNQQPFSHGFFDKDPETSRARANYLKALIGGVLATSLIIWAALPIYWGALWKPINGAHNMNGWIVDYDGGEIGQAVTQALLSVSGPKNFMSFQVVPASQFPSPSDLAAAILDEKAWMGIAINSGASNALIGAAGSASSSYNGSLAITVYAVEARNENAYRNILAPMINGVLQSFSQQFAIQFAHQLVSQNVNVTAILTNAPNIITQPVYYTIDNIRPFNVPVASAVDFVGLIYLLILSFFTTNIHYQAFAIISDLDRRLTLPSLLKLRLLGPILSYFVLSLSYALVSLAFKVPFSNWFGNAGFLIYWMLSWMAMSALGLALEAVLTLVTIKFTPFFLIIWLIVNVSVSLFPIQILPTIFRYGFATPFYNVSRAVRAIVFGTKNDVGLNFGVQFIWIAISCCTLVLFQSWMRARAVRMEKERVEGQKVDI